MDSAHRAPHYHVMAKPVHTGFAAPILNYLRKFFIEDLYRRLGESYFWASNWLNLTPSPATMFPETANWQTSSDK